MRVGEVAALEATSAVTRRRWAGVDPLEIAIGLGAVAWLLPGAWPSRMICIAFWWVLNNLGVSQRMGGWFFYGTGGLLGACLIIVYIRQRGDLEMRSPTLRRFADALCLLMVLSILDIALSTANSYTPETTWQAFCTLTPFFICLLYLNSRQSMRLVRILAICTGVQASYAIFYYVTSQHQFYTPRFGNRTSGTFESPNQLYPLCLMGAPLCLALCRAQSARVFRLLFGFGAAANLAALIFTYTRAGWFGMAIAALIALRLPGSPWRGNRHIARFVVVLSTAAILGTVFVRTHGSAAATAGDRSTLGRFQIWLVSLNVIAQRPWLGSGLSTYQERQGESMSPELERFNPMNSEAKSIYLNVWAEMGLAGLSILLLSGFRYAQFCRAAGSASYGVSRERSAILFASAVSGIAIAIAGLADTPILHFARAPDTFALMVLLGAAAAITRDAVPADGAIKRASARRSGIMRTAYVCVGAVAAFCLLTAISTTLFLCQARPVMDHYVQELKQMPLYADNRQITEEITNCLIATEDSTFYTHHGVDWEAERRSLSEDIRSLSLTHGGSTITMQAVRYTMLPYTKSPARKIAQIVLAMRLERRISKQQILRLYIDSVTFGLHTAGLQNAAKTYFGKRPEKLTLAECAFLIGAISHPPAAIREVTPQFVHEKRDPVLYHLEQLYTGQYTAAEFERARQQRLHFAWEH